MPAQTLTERTRSIVSRGGEHVLVLGGGHLGRELARTLAESATVTLVDDDEDIVRCADRDDVEAHCADPTDVHALQEADAARADVAVVAATPDRRSVLTTQLLRTQFGVESVVVLVRDSRVLEAVDVEGVETVSVPDSVFPDLEDAVDRRIREREGS